MKKSYITLLYFASFLRSDQTIGSAYKLEISLRSFPKKNWRLTTIFFLFFSKKQQSYHLYFGLCIFSHYAFYDNNKERKFYEIQCKLNDRNQLRYFLLNNKEAYCSLVQKVTQFGITSNPTRIDWWVLNKITT